MKRHGTAYGHEVRRVRQQHHLTQAEVAAAIGITREGLAKIECSATRRTNDAPVRGLAHVLGIPCHQALELLGTLPPRCVRTQ